MNSSENRTNTDIIAGKTSNLPKFFGMVAPEAAYFRR